MLYIEDRQILCLSSNKQLAFFLQMKAMLAYLEAARYKIQCSLDELNNRPKTVHPLAKHIEVHRDKQGLTCSVLKVKLLQWAVT